MKRIHWPVILTGVVVGIAALLLTASGNPGNMGFCIACFLRDISGSLGLHSAAKVQYIRPEIIGLVLGAFGMAVARREFRGRAGSMPALRFVLGALVMVGALAFLGCPLRMVLRLGGGDPTAIAGLLGFVGGILVGVGMAFIFLSGSTTGGSDVVGYLLQKKYPHVSIGRALMMIDGIILSTSIFVFGNVDAALFGLISLYAQTKVIDMIIYGNDAGSEASIVTKYPQKIAERVIKEIDRTVTLLPGKGGYSGEDTTVVLCTVRKTEFNRLKRIIAETDENAFVIVKETSGIFGLGFKDVAEAQQ